MPAKNQALTLTYTAWDTANQVGKTGDSANHTLKVVVDGTEQAVAGTIAEVDPTNLKGEYKVTLSAGNMDGNMIKFGGVSSTSGIVIVPIAIFTDGGVLPAPGTAPGSAGGLPTADAGNGVKLSVGTGSGQVNVASGVVPANVTEFGGHTVATDSAGLPSVNVQDIAGSAIGAGGVIPANVTQWSGTDVASSDPSALLVGLVSSGDHTEFTAHALALAPSGGGGGLSLSSALTAPRALDAVADGSITLNDALWCAVAAAAGKESISGTSYLVQTPSTGTTIRTFTLNSSSSPTARS